MDEEDEVGTSPEPEISADWISTGKIANTIKATARLLPELHPHKWPQTIVRLSQEKAASDDKP
jgi:hypothetical protein